MVQPTEINYRLFSTQLSYVISINPTLKLKAADKVALICFDFQFMAAATHKQRQ